MYYELIKNNVRVSLSDECNEGWNGDYNPDDPNDEMLLRFDVSVRVCQDEWVYLESYCTQLPNTISTEQAVNALRHIMFHVYDGVVANNSIKRTCERLSWISPEDV